MVSIAVQAPIALMFYVLFKLYLTKPIVQKIDCGDPMILGLIYLHHLLVL